jgi:hypothetical protein
MKRIWILALAVVLFVPALTSASTVTLGWDASVTPSVTGYKIYVGTSSGSYGAGIDVGNVLLFTVPNLNEGTKYYFVATAYNPETESEYSNEVSTTTLTPAILSGGMAITGGEIH